MIDAARVHELLKYDGLVEALRQAHLGGMPEMSDRKIFQQPHPNGDPDILIVLPAWQPKENMLVKIVTSFPRNKSTYGVSNVNSLYVFLNGTTGVTEAVIDGEAMIFRKTSADSALGASLLARKDSRSLLMIGAGALAPYLVRAHRSVHPSIENVMVWNRTASNADRLVQLLGSESIRATAVRDLDDAVRRADIISSATMAHEPLIKGRFLKPGVHVDLVGSFTPEMRESDDDVLKRARIFVDHRQTTKRSGEFVGPFERGVITPDDVRGDLFELCQKKVEGRTSPDQVTLMKNGGGSHLDYYVSKYLVDCLNHRAFHTSCAS